MSFRVSFLFKYIMKFDPFAPHYSLSSFSPTVSPLTLGCDQNAL